MDDKYPRVLHCSMLNPIGIVNKNIIIDINILNKLEIVSQMIAYVYRDG